MTYAYNYEIGYIACVTLEMFVRCVKIHSEQGDGHDPDHLFEQKELISMIGTVVVSNVNGRTLARKGDRIFILNTIGHVKGEEVVFEEKEAIEMPSMLYALSMLGEKNMSRAVQFIQNNF